MNGEGFEYRRIIPSDLAQFLYYGWECVASSGYGLDDVAFLIRRPARDCLPSGEDAGCADE